LIVDDNRTNLRILDGILRRWDFRSKSVQGGKEALTELSAGWQGADPYALILTDRHMPEMDGFSLIEQIRQRPELSTAVIMMLTSSEHRRDTERCNQLGVSASLLKPIRQGELREALSRIIGAPEQNDETSPRHDLLPGKDSLGNRDGDCAPSRRVGPRNCTASPSQDRT
jgi:CheY-like chemotaxis protein